MSILSDYPIQLYRPPSEQPSEELELTLRVQRMTLSEAITQLATQLLHFDFMSGYNYPMVLYQKKSVVLYRGTAETILQHAIRHAQMWLYRYVMSKKLIALMKQSLILTEKSNRLHGPHAPAAVILQAIDDPEEILASTMFFSDLACIAKTHYISLQILGEREQLGSIIRDAQHELGSRPITALIIRAHGHANSIASYTTDQAKAEDFACLDPQANIYFDACCTGLGLAERIASIQPRPVYAATGSVCPVFFTNCSRCHQLEMITFNETCNPNVKKFLRNENSVVATIPCSAADDTMDTICRAMLQQIFDNAESGDSRAQSMLGQVYKNGYLNAEQSYIKAASWYRKAAEQGSPDAQSNLSRAFRYGQGVVQSEFEASYWCRRSARRSLELENRRSQQATMEAFHNMVCPANPTEPTDEAGASFVHALLREANFNINNVSNIVHSSLESLFSLDDAIASSEIAQFIEDTFIPTMRGLRRLDCSSFDTVTNDQLQTICRACPNLQNIDVTHCHNITDAGLAPLIARGITIVR